MVCTLAIEENIMQVGDLIKPKDISSFAALGYAVILSHDGGNVVIAWLDRQIPESMRWWLLEMNMEVVCK